MIHVGNALLDDRALVQVGGDKVRGGADNLDAALKGLMIRLRTLEAGQEGVVNVDDAAAHRTAESWGEDLHVAGEDDELNVVLTDQVEDLLLLLQLGVLVHGEVVEGDAVALGQGLVLWMVGDYEGNLSVKGCELAFDFFVSCFSCHAVY